MASSRKRNPKPDPAATLDAELLDALRFAVERLPTPPPSPLAPVPRRQARAPLVFAFSGGADSTALLHAAATLRERRTPGFSQLHAVHVHHGLQPAAEQWVSHCEEICARLRITLEVRRVQVTRQGQGIEAAAREARYQALTDAAQSLHARAVLTAHHRDDQIETFLIQWLRGAGPEGLAGLPAQRSLHPNIALLRPFLALSRTTLADYVTHHRLAFVDDPSNLDTAIVRNGLRARVLPVLEELRPGYAKAAARSVELLGEAAEVLRSVAQEDLAVCALEGPPPALRLDRVMLLPAARRALLLRRWLAAHGVPAPSRARLDEALAQALHARSDARLLIRAASAELRRHRGLLILKPTAPATPAGRELHWRGEHEIALPEWQGVLRFELTEGEGFEPAWLQDRPLFVRSRSGGERFKPHASRPSKTLKKLFQEAGVPEYERGLLPLVWRDESLIFVAGLGADVRLIDRGGERVLLRWRPDAGLIDL